VKYFQLSLLYRKTKEIRQQSILNNNCEVKSEITTKQLP